MEVKTPVARDEGSGHFGKKDGHRSRFCGRGSAWCRAFCASFRRPKWATSGVYRDPDTLAPVEYYCKLPTDIGERDVIIVDPMLATGGSAVAAIDFIKQRGARSASSSWPWSPRPKASARLHDAPPGSADLRRRGG